MNATAATTRPMMPRATTWVVVAACTAITAAISIGTWPVFNRIEEPRHTIEYQVGALEIRSYEGVIAAEVEIRGERTTAINQGFSILAGYIFGSNKSTRKIGMTAPVTQQGGEKIAMTAPVTQQAEGDVWKVRFMMPAHFTRETLPEPNDARVRIVVDEPKRFAAVRFSGLANDARIAEERAKLLVFVADQKREAPGAPVLAFYNPPWTLPFLRRNEIMVEINR